MGMKKQNSADTVILAKEEFIKAAQILGKAFGITMIEAVNRLKIHNGTKTD